MRRLTLTTTATAIMLAAAPALAQDAMMNESMTDSDWAELIRTRDITGGTIYTTNEAYDEGSWGSPDDYRWGWTGYDAVGADWNQIGEIEDIILNRSGEMIGVVAEVGGFLDIGDKHVLLRVGDVDLFPVDDASYAMITRYSEEELEDLPSVDEGWWN